MCLFPNQGAWLLGGLSYPSDLMREPCGRAGDSGTAIRLASGDFRRSIRPRLGRLLQPASPPLASDRGWLTGPTPIIKIGQEPLIVQNDTRHQQILNQAIRSAKLPCR